MGNSIQEHPQLLAILSAIMNGASLQEVASRFAVPVEELRSYAESAGLLTDPAGQPPDYLSSEAVEQPTGEEQRQEKAAVREDPEQLEEERYQRLRELAGAEERAYLAQSPQPALYLTSDSQWRPGLQTGQRIYAHLRKIERKREERIAAWKASPWNWMRQVPPELLR